MTIFVTQCMPTVLDILKPAKFRTWALLSRCQIYWNIISKIFDVLFERCKYCNVVMQVATLVIVGKRSVYGQTQFAANAAVTEDAYEQLAWFEDSQIFGAPLNVENENPPPTENLDDDEEDLV